MKSATKLLFDFRSAVIIKFFFPTFLSLFWGGWRAREGVRSIILEYKRVNVNVSKLLGVHFHQHLNWDEHVKATCKSCYGTIQIIRKLKNFAGYRLRKHLVESLVLSKLDYCDTVYYPLPEFQLKRLQRVQLVAASFVLNRYVNDINDIVKIGWLLVRQRRDFHVLKLVHQALYSPSWPSYVPLDTVKHLRSLRSGAATRF